MEYYVFKTDIASSERVDDVRVLFSSKQLSNSWSVDTEDVDHVLRVKISLDLKECQVEEILQNQGFFCEALPD